MDDEWEEYLQKIEPVGTSVDERTGHYIVSALLAFRMGLYDQAVRRVDRTLDRITRSASLPGVVGRSLMVVGEQARKNRGDEVHIRSAFTFEGGDPTKFFGGRAGEKGVPVLFEESDREYLAIAGVDDDSTTPDILTLDNACMLLYAVSFFSSPDDRQSLEEQVLPLLLQKYDTYRQQR